MGSMLIGVQPTDVLYDFIPSTYNRCLDLTIEKLGKNNVQKKLDEYLKLLYIGTSFARDGRNKTGCGIMNLHERLQPYDDIHQLPWFHRLPEEDKEYVLSLK